MTQCAILVVNGGSSSLKCALFCVTPAGPERVLDFEVTGLPASPHCRAAAVQSGEITSEPIQLREGIDPHVGCLHEVIERLQERDDVPEIVVVGHRVVHGGDRYVEPTIVDPAAHRELQALSSLAPLHQPVSLELIECCRNELPGTRQIACFDTGFHRRQPSVARDYALPQSLRDSGIHRFGFHGISYEYVWHELQRSNAIDDKLTVVAHFGAGASLCAIENGRSVATTMGFSTVDGMPMATRSGSLDPGVLIYLLREKNMSVDELERLLYKESGLLALSGLSGDMIELRGSNDPRARSAISHFVYRAVREIGSLAAALGGLDVLVFTGGIGANDVEVRKEICADCRWLGVVLDDAANTRNAGVISADSSRVDVRVIASNEELQIARSAMQFVD